MYKLFLLFFIFQVYAREKWSEDQAWAWFNQFPYLQGSQFIPSDAGNQLEMFQANTFNPELIDAELGLGQALGSNVMRIFMHDLAYKEDPSGFKARLDTVIGLCAKHGIKPLLVFFDSCWAPDPHVGKQPEPVVGSILSSWFQSPGVPVLLNQTQWPRLETYVKDVVGTFAKDDRILGWDIFNEPYWRGNDEPQKQAVIQLLTLAFEWARSMDPVQPLTSAVFGDDYLTTPSETTFIQLNNSDVISFHYYTDPSWFETHVKKLVEYGRPIICSEYMAPAAYPGGLGGPAPPLNF